MATATDKITLEQVERPRGQIAGRWLVKRGDVIIGMLEKFNNTRTDTHPWKAYAGVGMHARFLGAFFVTGQVRADADHVVGGKRAAIAAILAAS